MPVLINAVTHRLHTENSMEKRLADQLFDDRREMKLASQHPPVAWRREAEIAEDSGGSARWIYVARHHQNCSVTAIQITALM